MKFDDILATPGTFLLIGEPGPELAALKRARWKGVSVNPPGTWGHTSLSDEDYYSGITYVEAIIFSDSHFRRTLEGYWVKPTTVKEVFNQWGNRKFTLICITDVMASRALWFVDEIQSHLPQYYVLRDDGNNDSVIFNAKVRGYAHQVLEGSHLLFQREKP